MGSLAARGTSYSKLAETRRRWYCVKTILGASRCFAVSVPQEISDPRKLGNISRRQRLAVSSSWKTRETVAITSTKEIRSFWLLERSRWLKCSFILYFRHYSSLLHIYERFSHTSRATVATRNCHEWLNYLSVRFFLYRGRFLLSSPRSFLRFFFLFLPFRARGN